MICYIHAEKATHGVTKCNYGFRIWTRVEIGYSLLNKISNDMNTKCISTGMWWIQLQIATPLTKTQNWNIHIIVIYEGCTSPPFSLCYWKINIYESASSIHTLQLSHRIEILILSKVQNRREKGVSNARMPCVECWIKRLTLIIIIG